MIDIVLNGEKRQIEGSSVDALLVFLGISGQSVAIAINDAVVPASQHPATTLSQGDRVEIVRPMGGG